MADAPAERSTTRQPSSRGREDTVVRPMPPQPGSNGQPSSSSGSSGSSGNGDGKVLPPMPPQAPKPAAKPTARSNAAKRPAKKSAKRAARPSAPPPQARTQAPTGRPGPKPSAPPPQVVAAAAAVAAPAVIPTPAPAAPVGPKVKAPKPTRPAKTPKPARPAKAAKPKKTVTVVREEPRPGRRARLRMTRIDPWSVLKTSFLLSIALGIVTVVSVFMVWSVLDAADVWTSINQTVRDIVGGQDANAFDIEDYIGTRRVVGFTMIVAAVDVVLLTAIATLGAFLYNMSASLLGGIEVTLAEDK